MAQNKRQQRAEAKAEQGLSLYNKLKKNGVLQIAFVSALVVLVGGAIYTSYMKDDDPEYLKFHKQGEATLTNADGQVLATIDLEIADTEATREVGMMYRRSMKDNQGMLFVFPVEEPRSFWMRNTYLALDMIYVNAAGHVVTIQRNTTPLKEIHYTSDVPALYVLEVVAGFADRVGVDVGDRLTWKKTVTAPAE
ncbi:MAG: DUF192 domain-containing protein [candidate division Zixibacteria bacterium]|nr:DUF192 domain-containing protein [candidate division Zixibacteria bacterium]